MQAQPRDQGQSGLVVGGRDLGASAVAGDLDRPDQEPRRPAAAVRPGPGHPGRSRQPSAGMGSSRRRTGRSTAECAAAGTSASARASPGSSPRSAPQWSTPAAAPPPRRGPAAARPRRRGGGPSLAGSPLGRAQGQAGHGLLLEHEEHDQTIPAMRAWRTSASGFSSETPAPGRFPPCPPMGGVCLCAPCERLRGRCQVFAVVGIPQARQEARAARRGRRPAPQAAPGLRRARGPGGCSGCGGTGCPGPSGA